MEYFYEVIFALMRFHPEMKGYGWCAACRALIEPHWVHACRRRKRASPRVSVGA